MTESFSHMTDYLKLLVEHGCILGTFDPAKVSGLPPQWFWDRQQEVLDFRGDLQIRCSQTITFGRKISIYTASHDFRGGVCGGMVTKRCWIDKGVFVGSKAVLYDCWLQEGSIVSIGSVVIGIRVPPYCVVAGNPAKIIKEYRDGYWRNVLHK